ncbi:MAG: vanadium-dependent haloperoxidase [Limisphaerales bacterium]
MRPFTMVSGDQFRPQPPPALNTAAYSYEFETVKQYGAANSTVRTPNQTEVALFWADGGGTATPPGHWNVIAQDVATARSLTLAENARLFALLNLATADSAIACWDAKYAYNLWRPITAVREADNDGNPETVGDPAWTPLIATPPFPEYSSGHSTFSRSSATVLAGFFGTDAIAFTTTSDGLPGVTRNYAGFSAAADEAGISRIFGGIHWPSANLHAQACGTLIGQQVLAHFLVPLQAAVFTHIRATTGARELEVTVEPNRPYVIHASSDLVNWTPIATVSSPTDRATFTDTNPPAGARFYQAVAR